MKTLIILPELRVTEVLKIKQNPESASCVRFFAIFIRMTLLLESI